MNLLEAGNYIFTYYLNKFQFPKQLIQNLFRKNLANAFLLTKPHSRSGFYDIFGTTDSL